VVAQQKAGLMPPCQAKSACCSEKQPQQLGIGGGRWISQQFHTALELLLNSWGRIPGKTAKDGAFAPESQRPGMAQQSRAGSPGDRRCELRSQSQGLPADQADDLMLIDTTSRLKRVAALNGRGRHLAVSPEAIDSRQTVAEASVLFDLSRVEIPDAGGRLEGHR
jgi:hypothetical protein